VSAAQIEASAAPDSDQAAASSALTGWRDPVASGRWSGFGSAVIAIALYLVLGIALFWGIWSSHPTSVSEPGGDQFAFMWLLKWTPFALAHGHSPFYSDYSNYPLGVNLLTNTGIQLLGFIASPITWLWGSVASFNVLMTVAMPASATSAYFVARRWVSWRPAAFVAGLLYGFSPYEIGQSAGHLDLTFIVVPPLVLLMAHELCVRQHWSPRWSGVGLGLLVTAQFFVSSEVMVSTLVITGIFVLTTAVVERRQLASRWRRALSGVLWAAGTAAVLLAYPVWFALRGPSSIRGPIQLVPQAYRADLAGLVIPDSLFRFDPAGLAKTAASFANSTTENGSYLGITLLLLILVGSIVLWRRSGPLRVATIVGAVAVILSLGSTLVVTGPPSATPSGIPLPGKALAKLPVLSNGIPVRYSLYVALFAALLLALILDHLHTALVERSSDGVPRRAHSKGGRRRQATVSATVIPLALAVIALLPLLPAAQYPVAAIGTPAFFSSADLQKVPPGSTAVVYPYATAVTPNSQQWQAAADMRFRMPAAYFLLPKSRNDHTIAFGPALGYTRDTLTARVLVALYNGQPPTDTPQLRASLLAQFHSWHVRTFIAFPTLGADPAGCVGFMTWLLGGPPTGAPGLADVWYAIPG
jgi:hypothetical protein